MKNIVRLLTALFFATALLAGCGGSSSTVSPAALKTTVLVYIEGTNLEDAFDCQDAAGKTVFCSAATNNIYEMLAAESSQTVKVVLQTGAANKAVAGEPVDNWKTVRRYVIEDKKLVLKDDTLGAIDMGDPKVLTNFITWGQSTYSAEKYVLIFWDHGGGALGGFGGNSTVGQPGFAKNMDVQQLKSAVDAAVANDPKKKFELIGFDACLMATLEVAQAFKTSARYLAASQDVEPGAGWDWTALLNYVIANPGADGAAIGGKIADSYLTKMNKGNTGDLVTFSVTNLAKVDRINTALAAFSSKYSTLLAGSTSLTAWGDLASSRSWANDFSGEAVDMLTMFKNERTASDGPEGMELANATTDAVVKNVVGRYTRAVSGLNVMFPTESVWNANGNLTTYAGFNFLVPEYQALVKTYSDYAVGTVKDTTFGPASLAADSKTMMARITSANPKYEQVYVAINAQQSVLGADGKTVTENAYFGHQPVWSTSGDASEFSYASDAKWFMLNGKLASVIANPTTEKGIQTIKIPMHIERTVAKGGDCGGVATKLCMEGMYYLLYDFDKDVLVKTVGFVATFAYNQFAPPEQLATNDVVFLKYFVMPADSTTKLGSWNAIDDDKYKFTMGATPVVFEKAAIPLASDYAFLGFDLRWKQFVSSSVKLQ